MREELKIFLTALSFYTRIRVSISSESLEAYLNNSIRYLPLIGWITGGISGVILTSLYLLLSPGIAVIFSIVTTILLTGALHEDGLADVCDGFGGGWTKEKILEIMKDSRMGTYGAVGLIFVLSIKFYAISQLLSGLIIPEKSSVILLILFIVIGHSLSRFNALTMVFSHQYVRIGENKSASMVSGTAKKNLYIAVVFALLPLVSLIIYTQDFNWLLVLLPLAVLRFFMARYFNKWIGGYTGDCLGAIQQVSEVVIYLCFIVLWKYF